MAAEAWIIQSTNLLTVQIRRATDRSFPSDATVTLERVENDEGVNFLPGAPVSGVYKTGTNGEYEFVVPPMQITALQNYTAVIKIMHAGSVSVVRARRLARPLVV